MPVTPNVAALVDMKTAQALGERLTVAAEPATTSATSSTPFGYTQAQADLILTLVIDLRRVLVRAGLVV